MLQYIYVYMCIYFYQFDIYSPYLVDWMRNSRTCPALVSIFGNGDEMAICRATWPKPGRVEKAHQRCALLTVPGTECSTGTHSNLYSDAKIWLKLSETTPLQHGSGTEVEDPLGLDAVKKPNQYAQKVATWWHVLVLLNTLQHS